MKKSRKAQARTNIWTTILMDGKNGLYGNYWRVPLVSKFCNLTILTYVNHFIIHDHAPFNTYFQILLFIPSLLLLPEPKLIFERQFTPLHIF